HTRFSRDWSSDVCSSDLLAPLDRVLEQLEPGGWGRDLRRRLRWRLLGWVGRVAPVGDQGLHGLIGRQAGVEARIGRGLCLTGQRSEEHTSELQSRENLVC